MTVHDVMTTDVISCPTTATIADAARLMRDCNIGDVLVVGDDRQLAGIVTDRDLVVRCLADGAAADQQVQMACSSELITVEPVSTVDEAVRLMRECSLRRLPVVSNGNPVGIVSLGDLAVERDPDSVLADISAAEPNS
jgi:CBS domain-containing protein